MKLADIWGGGGGNYLKDKLNDVGTHSKNKYSRDLQRNK
jgi:hypothetical protein